MDVPAFIIAGTHSGCGKTTVTLGLMAAFKKLGYSVLPFKIGPDFIDPGHHTRITGHCSHNLDGWMLDRKTNQELFARIREKAGIVVGEGVMGLFDGFSATDEAGSTAQMAKWLDLPVLLVVDARSMARSVAALVQGYTRFDPDITLAGVLCNRVGSPGHARILKEALHTSGCPPCLGCLPRQEDVTMPSRHLGLYTAQDMEDADDSLTVLTEWIEEHVHLDRLLEATQSSALPPANLRYFGGQKAQKRRVEQSVHPRVRIGLARDQAFCFYYPQNLRLLEEAGAELVVFSPLQDRKLPDNLQGLYLGGGYPELHAEALAANQDLREDIAGFAARGGPVYGECGGFMYCMHSLEDGEGRVFPMLGIFPFRARMDTRLRALGYREVCLHKDTLLGPAGTVIRGHEFHYSSIVNTGVDATAETDCVYVLRERKGNAETREGYTAHNVLASYVHLHFASCPHAAQSLVRFCRDWA